MPRLISPLFSSRPRPSYCKCPRLILASPETAADVMFESIEAVVAHEYFHNWTGNRITCRDWFQLCLKEGLTVFREQEFSADQRSRAVQRIKDVKRLRARQFGEDAGPLAHPVRPASYQKIDNFYTATVYEKGGEVIRAALGPELEYQPDELRQLRRELGAAVTVVCSPNNPTGGVLETRELSRVCEASDGLVVVDEAYHEFSGQSAVELLPRHPNLVVLRTFSKAMGLAGLRIGYLLAAPELAREVLIAQIAGMLRSPIQRLAGVLAAVAEKKGAAA